ncbi:MAG TPA: 2OG-Fe(II) oxygenase [Elusimicrobiota bacterium]|nr:2OG-Fe(II) oxygenase [Elusimicrobiota bacterium]
MKSREHPAFRPRFLLNPFYLVRRLQEMRSFGEFARALANVFVLIAGMLKNAGYALHGFPRLFASRLDRAHVAARSRSRPRPPLARASAFTTRRPPSGDSFAAREPLSLLDPAVLAGSQDLAERFQAGKPFKHVVIDGLLDPDFCGALTSEFPPYDAARFRNEHGDLGKAEHADVSRLGAPFRKLDELFRSPEFLRWASAVTGIPDLLYDPEYVGGGAHENLEDMELDPHVDFTIHRATGWHRRVNMLLYLNLEWEESWGGSLELHVNPWLPAGQNPVRTIAPLFNRCVLFETSDRSWHGFRAIRFPAEREGLTRRSFALYLYTRAKPRGFAAIPGDLTVFVDRPLPPELAPGRTLSAEDVRVMRHAVVRRDWKLRYLYDRAIALHQEWRASEEKLGEEREALKLARAENALLANDLLLCRAQLLECLKALAGAKESRP